MKQLLTSILLLIAVTGCSLLPTKPVEVNTISLPAPMYHPPLPMEIQAVGVEWKVLTPEIMAEYLDNSLKKVKLLQVAKVLCVNYASIRKLIDEYG